MKYRDSNGRLDTPKKILKVNHAGEFGAINIYKAQILVSRLLGRNFTGMLEALMADERRHMDTFWAEIQRRDGVKCKSYWLCGVGGWCMGLISALFGRTGIMACTWAVESVVVNHLHQQIVYLESKNDIEALLAVRSILADEKNHRDIGLSGGGGNPLYAPFRFVIGAFTEIIIRLGMR